MYCLSLQRDSEEKMSASPCTSSIPWADVLVRYSDGREYLKQDGSKSMNKKDEDYHEPGHCFPVNQESPSRVNTMIKSLENVKQNPGEDRQIIDLWMRKFFQETFDACRSNVVIEFDRRSKLGALIEETMRDMDVFLLGLGEGFDDCDGLLALIVRSGFQFMIENFKDFPNNTGGTLENSFEYFKKMDTVEALDETLASFKESSYYSDESLTYTPDQLKRPGNVPVSHHWWFDE